MEISAGRRARIVRLVRMSEPVVPGFDAVELLGFGSGGEVWLARERASGLPVALKRLRPGADLAARDRLRREAAVLAGVDHPHIVRLRGVHGEADGDGLVLVLDLAAGGSLTRLLALRGRLNPGEVVTLVVPLAQALAAVHSQGLVHGDVAPANVLFAAEGRPVLSDLGVSRLIGEPAGASFGTTGFLDPAVAAGAMPGPASDVHGLAATALAALTGTAPYDEFGCRRTLPEDIHPGLLGALEPAMAADPRDRPSAEALAVAVFDAAPAAPVRLEDTPSAASVTPRHTAAARDEEHAIGVAARRPDPWGASTVEPGGVGASSAGPGAAPTHQVRPTPPYPEEVDPGTDRSHQSRFPAAFRRRSRAALVVSGVGVTLALAAATGIAWASAGGEPSAAGVATRAQTTRGTTQPLAERAGAAGVSTRAQGAAQQEAKGAGTSVGVAVPDAMSSAAADSGTTVAWRATLAALDAARSKAFATGDPALLDAVYAPSAPALRRDRHALAEITDVGVRARGLHMTAGRVRVMARTPDRVRLRVTDVMPPYALVDADGAVVERRAGRGERSWSVVLVRVGAVWRVYDVLRA